jgi:hypothetical protein
MCVPVSVCLSVCDSLSLSLSLLLSLSLSHSLSLCMCLYFGLSRTRIVLQPDSDGGSSTGEDEVGVNSTDAVGVGATESMEEEDPEGNVIVRDGGQLGAGDGGVQSDGATSVTMSFSPPTRPFLLPSTGEAQV